MTTVGIVGAGTMGAGIAEVVLGRGDEVVLHDVDPAAIERARARIADGLARRPPTDGDAGAALARLRSADTLDAMGAEAELIVEAVIEDLALKSTVVRALDAASPADVPIATNTSALSVAVIAASATAHPERVLGLHWFNPVPRMALVEVVEPEGVEPAIVERAAGLVAGWGKTPVRCRDTPGFIVNRVNRPFTIEALRIVERGAASSVDVDRAMRTAGFPMGPFELMDLIGIDVNLAAATAVWEGLGRPAHLRPSPLQAELVAAGHLGRKSGRGFYRYVDGRADGPAGPFAPSGRATVDDASIVSAIATAIGAEARRAVDAGVAGPADIDLALRLGAGHPVGPFGSSVGDRSVMHLRGVASGR